MSLIPGDGIGPEISQAVRTVFEAADVPIEWDVVDVKPVRLVDGRMGISPSTISTIKKNKIGLKGPLETPIGKGHVSLNLTLRKLLNLYANVRPCRSIPGCETAYKDVDLVVIRENTEGEYSGIEHEVVSGVVQSIKVITRAASERIARYAFDYAVQSGRNHVTVVHKATIMRQSDGLFLDVAKEVAQEYPKIGFRDISIDTACLRLVHDPDYFKRTVMMMPNLYGDIMSDMSAGLVGGLGLTASGNIGQDGALFESVHGTAPDIAGKNMANPTALLLSGVMMLDYMGLVTHGQAIKAAIFKTLGNPSTRTGDLGGKCSTTEYTAAVIDNLRH